MDLIILYKHFKIQCVSFLVAYAAETYSVLYYSLVMVEINKTTTKISVYSVSVRRKLRQIGTFSDTFSELVKKILN